MINFPSDPIDPQEIIEKLRRVISAAEQQSDTQSVLLARKKLGQAYMEVGDAPQALTEFNEAIKLVKEDENQENLAQLLGLRGLALKLIGNYSQALQAFRKSNTLALKLNHEALSCDSFIHIASLHSEMERFDESIEVLTKALDLAIDHKDKVRKMRICGLLGDNYLKRSETHRAKEYFMLANEAAQELGNQSAECSFITKVGNVLLLEGETERAVDKYKRALAIASAVEDSNAEINILGGLFRSHALIGEVHPAQVYGEQAIHLASQISHHEAEVTNIIALASYLIEQNRFDKVFALIERGLQLVRAHSNLGVELTLLNLQGQANFLQDRYAEALASWNAGLSLATQLQDEGFMAILYGQIAAVYAETGDLVQSVDQAEKALALAGIIGDPKLAAEQQILLAFNYQDLGEDEKAISYCKAAIDTYQCIEDSKMIEQAQSLLIDLESQ